MLLNCGVGEDSWRVPWTAKRYNQSILKEISSEYSLEGLMLKLKLQYFGHLMWTDLLEKTLMLGKIEGRRRRGQQRWDVWMASLTWLDVSLSKLPELVMDREAWYPTVYGLQSRTQLSNWTELILVIISRYYKYQIIILYIWKFVWCFGCFFFFFCTAGPLEVKAWSPNH